MSTVNNNYISGQWVPSLSGKTFDQFSPANLTKTTGTFQLSNVADTQSAIEAAAIAFPKWAGLTVYQRAEYLKKTLSLMIERSEEIARIITLENGKTLTESKGEVASAVKEMEHQINEGIRMAGQILPSAQPNVLAYQVRRPLGPIGVISPWNFPFNVPIRKIVPALIAGNTCILKPAQLTSGAGIEFVKIFADAGLPAGVLNMITGSGRIIGDELVTNPGIHAITFTGSTEVGMAIHARSAATMKRTQLEMGGKNPLVILEDANMKAAAASAALAAFACAGQWCISTSRVIIQKKVLSEFTELLMKHIDAIVVGDGMDPKSTMGPVCGEAQLKNVLAGIEKARTEGAAMLCGGKQIMTGEMKNGCFVGPTVFTNVTPDMSIAQEEVFGPVLAIMTVDNFEQAITIANDVQYGLGSSIYTNNMALAMEFVNRSEAGLTHVNMHTAYKEPQLSFGGVKLSGHGIPEAGTTGIEFFTEHKTIYINAQK